MKGLAIRAFMGGVLLCLIASSGSAQVPPAGTTIVNQALADYTEGSELRRSRSNPVTNQVLPVYDIRLTPPGTVASPAWVLAGAAGDTLYCVFDLSNGGNAPDSGAVGFGVVPPSNTAIADVIFFADANGNGRYDPGEDDRTFLALAAGATTRLDAGVVLPAGASGGDAFVEVRAASANDTTGAVRTSVVQVTNTGPPQMTLHLGPSGNARAAPGGEGSGDDLTVGFTDYTSTSFTFHNDVLNDGTAVDVYELAWNDTLSPPPQITVTFADSTGQQLPQSPSGSDVYRLGAVAPGETRPIQVIVSSTSGPLASALDGPLSLRIRARSAADTLQENHTVDRLIPPQAVNPAATLAIDQAFRERLATTGDVVTLLVTARNITDSLTVDSVVVDEWAQPQLDFAGSSDFRLENGRMVWRVGSLAGGQSRTAVVKFVANTRVNNGTARAFGNVTGVAETGDAVRAGPASSTIRLENGPFVDEAVVLGEVYVDDNENRRRDAGEQGVAEVAIYLDSGEYAVTDSLGRFSLPRAFAGWRAIRMDEQTIPGDLEFFVPPGSRDQGRRENETFIHVLPGGNANVSFRLRRIPPPTGEVEHAVTYHEQVSVTRHARLYRAFSIPSSYFGLGKAMLGLDAAEQLRPVVEFLHQHPDWGVLMEGHTDSTPINTEEYPSNMELSVARAEAVGLYLESMSIARDRMVMVGYGDTRPLASNETVEGRRQNRRVEVSLIPPGVRLDDGDLRRISATVKDLSALPDTFDVAVRWEFQTTSERPSEARLRVELPYKFRSANVLVTMDGEKITPEHGVYPLSGFGRSRAARCEITLRAASGDTASVGDIEAVVEIVDPEAAEPPQVASDVLSAPVSSSAPLSRPRKQFRIRPFAGTAGSRPRTVELMSWTETVVLNPDTSRAGPEIPAVDAGEPPQSQAEPVGDVDPEAGGAVVVLEPREGELFSRTDQIKIRARVPLGARTEVFVGDEALEDGHIGQKAIHVNEGFEEITWFAVRISPGWNSVSVRSTAVDGTVHGDTLRVALADRPGMIEAQRKRLLIPADGKSSDAVRFEVRDVRGFPVADGFVATVVAGDSLVSNADARPDMRGLQVVSSRGHFELQVRPSGVTKRRTIELECNGMTDRCDVSYVSAARPAMAIGLIDLRIGKYQTGGDGSREGLDRVAGASEEGTVTDAEARVFLQSALPYGAALTARVDTEKRDDEPLLKQVNPEAQYPIYGDASEYRMAAPTQTGNYLSVDKGESFLRYGDFRTPFTGGRYLYFHQVATGVTGSLVGDDGAIHGFVTDTEFATYRDEFRADGTSGFFYLNHAPVAENSERLFLETRQRYQEEIIVELKPLVRNRDYRINPFDGSILFHEPVPFTDRYLNPNYIVAIYEARTVEKSNYLFGVRGDLVRDRRYNVGGTAISNSGDGAAYSLYGTD
ncbi:MAG: OmpA family protein, partial [Candidatus Latescibacterota bacterium]